MGVDCADTMLELFLSLRLGDYLEKHVFGPLEMSSATMVLDTDQRSRPFQMHQGGHTTEVRQTLNKVTHESPGTQALYSGGAELFCTGAWRSGCRKALVAITVSRIQLL